MTQSRDVIDTHAGGNRQLAYTSGLRELSAGRVPSRLFTCPVQSDRLDFASRVNYELGF